MAKIYQIGFSEVSQVKKLVSLICNDDVLNYQRLFFNSVFSTFLQKFFPLSLRKKPETYVSGVKDSLEGVISVVAQKGNFYKWNIIRLFLNKNSYDIGKQLIDYVISKFGAIGVNTFFAEVDDFQEELLELFVKGSKFRMCSCIGFHKVTNINFFSEEEISDYNFRKFQISDAQKVAELFNDNIFPVFKNSLSKDRAEFFDHISSYFVKNTFKYVLETKSKELVAYIEITTKDNVNYIIDIVLSQGYYSLYSQILAYAIKQIMRHKYSKSIYVKNRKYLVLGHEIERFFRENHFEMLQNKVVLVKDFYKTTRQEVNLSAFSLGEIFSNSALGQSTDNLDKFH